MSKRPPYILFGNSGKVWSGWLYSSKGCLESLFVHVEFQSGFDRRCEPHVPQRLGHRVCSVPPALSWYLWPPDQHEGCLKNNHVSFGSLLSSSVLEWDGRPVALPVFVASWEAEVQELLNSSSASAANSQTPLRPSTCLHFIKHKVGWSKS